jgi:general secretion pathway protein G
MIDLMRTARRTAKARKGQGGWTLIELLVVLSLIMILASVSLNMYRNSIWRAREAALKSNLFHMRDAIDQYYADKARYPDSLETLVSEGYIRTVPEDPFTNSTTTWLTEPAPAQPGQLNTSPGIYDLKSGSDHIALDGSRVADWE